MCQHSWVHRKWHNANTWVFHLICILSRDLMDGHRKRTVHERSRARRKWRDDNVNNFLSAQLNWVIIHCTWMSASSGQGMSTRSNVYAPLVPYKCITGRWLIGGVSNRRHNQHTQLIMSSIRAEQEINLQTTFNFMSLSVIQIWNTVVLFLKSLNWRNMR